MPLVIDRVSIQRSLPASNATPAELQAFCAIANAKVSGYLLQEEHPLQDQIKYWTAHSKNTTRVDATHGAICMHRGSALITCSSQSDRRKCLTRAGIVTGSEKGACNLCRDPVWKSPL